MSEDDFVTNCPVCRKNCNCKACLRGDISTVGSRNAKSQKTVCPFLAIFPLSPGPVCCIMYLFAHCSYTYFPHRLTNAVYLQKIKLSSLRVLCAFCSLGSKNFMKSRC
jgi:hypothetical protein